MCFYPESLPFLTCEAEQESLTTFTRESKVRGGMHIISYSKVVSETHGDNESFAKCARMMDEYLMVG